MNVSCNVQIPLDAPGQILSLIGSGRVVPKFHYTEPTRPDQTHGPLRSPASPPTLSGRRLVRSVSICTDFVRGSGLVRSQTKSVGPCSGMRHRPGFVRDLVAGADMSGRVVEFRNDTTRPDQRRSLVGPVPNSTTRTLIGPDPTRQCPRICRKPERTQRALSEIRVSVSPGQEVEFMGCEHILASSLSSAPVCAGFHLRYIHIA